MKRRTGGFQGSNADQLEQEEKRKLSCKRRKEDAFCIEPNYYNYEQQQLIMVLLLPVKRVTVVFAVVLGKGVQGCLLFLFFFFFSSCQY